MGGFLLRNARVIDPLHGIDAIQDVAIDHGVFVSASELTHPVVFDLTGKLLAPGFTDVHVHLRDPGQTHKEDLLTASRAACAGGFTSILAMPNTLPPMDTAERVTAFLSRAQRDVSPFLNVYQAGCLTMERQGNVAADFRALKHAGCPAVTDDGSTPQSEDLMRQIMELAAENDLPVIDHCEDVSLSRPGVMHLGRVSQKLGLSGQPREAELCIVERDLRLAQQTGCRIHLQHLSCKESVEMLSAAQKKGVRASGEVTPHHLLLTEDACDVYGTNAKMAPPLREESDRQALLAALRSGVISIIATDHAPHTAEEKAAGWLKAPFGITGVEVAVPLLLTSLVRTGELSLQRMIEAFTTGPRELLRRPIGSLALGEPANVTILDLDAPLTIDATALHSKSTNCPWLHRECIGRAVMTICNGRLETSPSVK